MSDKKTKVRVEAVDTTCGASDHMTVDEIKKRSLDAGVELACPECGHVHLTKEEACEAAKRRVVESNEYRRVKDQAEES